MQRFSQAKDQSGAGSTFENIANGLAAELVNQVTEEHSRETSRMFAQMMELRGELERVTDLMKGYIERERTLHDLLENLNQTYAEATSHLHNTHAQFTETAVSTTGKHETQRRALADPLKDTEMEVNRIRALLAQPVILPADAPAHLRPSQVPMTTPRSPQVFPRVPHAFGVASTPYPTASPSYMALQASPIASPARLAALQPPSNFRGTIV